MPGYLLTDYTEKKLEITYGYFPPLRGGVFGYFRLHCVCEYWL
jgi:hypothetical protein